MLGFTIPKGFKIFWALELNLNKENLLKILSILILIDKNGIESFY